MTFSLVQAVASAVRTDPTISKYGLITFFLALAYASILAALPMDVFMDRTGYLIYATFSWRIFDAHCELGGLAVFFNEPVWLWINGLLSLFLSPDATVRTLIFASALTVALVVLRQNPRHLIWLVFILLFPQVIKNYIIHLRQGVAIAVFMAGWAMGSDRHRWGLWILTPFIHSSFFFVLGLWLASGLISQLKFGMYMRVVFFSMLGILSGGSILKIGATLGARQAETYEVGSASISGLGFLFWLCTFVILLWQGRTFHQKYAFQLSLLIYYLSTYFVLQVTGRVFESTMITVLLAGLQLTGRSQLAFLSAITFYFFYSYYTKLGLPWLGWGVR